MKVPANPSADKTPPSNAPEESDMPLVIDTQELLGARREATLVHAGERYRLRVTSNNKLILTK